MSKKKKKGLDLDTQKIVAWCRANIILVILIVVCIGAVFGLPKVATDWTDKVQEALKQRATSFKKIDSLQSTKVTPPGTNTSSKVAVNQALLDEYTEVTNTLIEDAQEVVTSALVLNRKDFSVLSTELFPKPPSDQRETLPQYFYKLLETEYKKLIPFMRAGSPVSRTDLAEDLEDERVTFMDRNLSTKSEASLTTEQRASLEKYLSEKRMNILRSHAEDISIYLTEADLNIPAFDIHTIPNVGTMFTWQWRYWVVADILGAIAKMNDAQSVLTSPIKRLVMLEVLGIPAIADGADQGGGNSGGGNTPKPTGGSPPPRPSPFGGGGSGPPPRPTPFGGGGGGGGFGGPSTPEPTPSGPSGGGGGGAKPPERGDESGSLAPSVTGRTSGEMYDVYQVRVKMIVNTEHIPTILDGFSSHNFFTIIDLDLQPEDTFVAIGDGFDYGSASVSELTIVLETVWLRAWTTQYMPDSVKYVLGIEVVSNE
jgi:hypothetical protein